jgi:hypothetical protein
MDSLKTPCSMLKTKDNYLLNINQIKKANKKSASLLKIASQFLRTENYKIKLKLYPIQIHQELTNQMIMKFNLIKKKRKEKDLNQNNPKKNQTNKFRSKRKMKM